MYSLRATKMKANGTTMELTAIYIVARLTGLLKSETWPRGGAMAEIFEKSIVLLFFAEVVAIELSNIGAKYWYNKVIILVECTC